VYTDNVITPGAPDLLSHISDTQQYVSTLFPAPYEYEQRWKKDWVPQEDALCAAVWLDGLEMIEQRRAESRLKELCSRFECRPLPQQPLDPL
jgi:hypothetical protein